MKNKNLEQELEADRQQNKKFQLMGLIASVIAIIVGIVLMIVLK